MPSIHKSTGSDGTIFKYQEPSKNKKGEAEGIMYLKVDKKTGERKLKNADGITGYLIMKLRGYSRATEEQANNYLQSRFPNSNVSTFAKNITFYDTSLYESKNVVSAHKFEQAIGNINNNISLIEHLKK